MPPVSAAVSRRATGEPSAGAAGVGPHPFRLPAGRRRAGGVEGRPGRGAEAQRRGGLHGVGPHAQGIGVAAGGHCRSVGRADSASSAAAAGGRGAGGLGADAGLYSRPLAAHRQDGRGGGRLDDRRKPGQPRQPAVRRRGRHRRCGPPRRLARRLFFLRLLAQGLCRPGRQRAFGAGHGRGVAGPAGGGEDGAADAGGRRGTGRARRVGRGGLGLQGCGSGGRSGRVPRTRGGGPGRRRGLRRRRGHRQGPLAAAPGAAAQPARGGLSAPAPRDGRRRRRAAGRRRWRGTLAGGGGKRPRRLAIFAGRAGRQSARGRRPSGGGGPAQRPAGAGRPGNRLLRGFPAIAPAAARRAGLRPAALAPLPGRGAFAPLRHLAAGGPLPAGRSLRTARRRRGGAAGAGRRFPRRRPEPRGEGVHLAGLEPWGVARKNAPACSSRRAIGRKIAPVCSTCPAIGRKRARGDPPAGAAKSACAGR